MGDGEKNAYHLVLLAKDSVGLKNLNKLCSRGHLEGYYYKPRIDDDILAENSEGLIALTACLGGRIPPLKTNSLVIAPFGIQELEANNSQCIEGIPILS